MEKGNKPDLIIGTSSGSLLAPIVAVSYQDKELMDQAIKFAQTLKPTDMFPYKDNKPFNKKGKPTVNAIFRVLFGHNHLGWQDIRPLYKKVFKEKHFKLLKKSSIKCIAFGVKGENGTPEKYVLNDACSLDEMIDMIEMSSRIVPFVQPMDGRIDGGFISFNPAM
jgi:predicted acylesterase/phospholipase RssA